MLHTLLPAVVAGVVLMLAANGCTTVYLHRTLAHRAVSVRGPVHVAFRTFVWISTGIRPRQWVAVHRKHHAFTDVPGDPHSPVLLGWMTVQRRNVTLYRREAKNAETVGRYARDIPQTRADRWFFDHAMLGLAIGLTFLVVVLGPVVGLLAAFVYLNLFLGTNAAVNAIGHHFGRKPYPNGAGNLQWLAFLTAGEGLHNNHHAAPTSAKLSHRWFEVDPGWWVIRILTVLHLAKVRLSELRLTQAASGAASKAAHVASNAAHAAGAAASNAAIAVGTAASTAASAVAEATKSSPTPGLNT
ncbi:MAG: fatty acid desaturase family protein [Ilumatobacteraceae bacterium]|nr:fatty acid desaturase family protein [Ilumatobacteraceae bacterium]